VEVEVEEVAVAAAAVAAVRMLARMALNCAYFCWAQSVWMLEAFEPVHGRRSDVASAHGGFGPC